MVTVHVDLRKLSGTTTDGPVSFASLRVSPDTGAHQLVKILDGVATFETPATDPGVPLTIVEYGFRGATVRHVTVPAGTDVDYGDLVDVEP